MRNLCEYALLPKNNWNAVKRPQVRLKISAFTDSHTPQKSCYNVISQVPLCYTNAHFKCHKHQFYMERWCLHSPWVAKWSNDSCASLPRSNRDHTTCTRVKSYIWFSWGYFAISNQLQCTFHFSFLLFVFFHRWMVTNNVWNNAYWCHITRQWAKCKFLLWNWQTKETIRPKEISATKMLVVIVWFHCEHTIVRNVSWLCTIGRASARFPFIPVALLIRSWFVCASDRSGFLTHTHNAHAPFQRSYDQEKQCFG